MASVMIFGGQDEGALMRRLFCRAPFAGPSWRTLVAAACLAPVALSAAAAQDDGLTVSGEASVVVGFTEDDTTADANAEVKVEGSRVLESGLEVGGVVEARIDSDVPDQYWSAGRYTGLTGGGPRGLEMLDGDAYLQSAYAYLRGGFGFVSLGRDNGIASQLAVTSPTIFRAIGVNDWQSDPSGLNDVHTINDFSGQATKLTYQPPANFLGGVLGGLQFGVSYSPELLECGEDICASVDGLPGTVIAVDGGQAELSLVTPLTSWENVLETAFYYEKGMPLGTDRLTVGLAASYLSAEETEAAPQEAAAITGLNLDDYRAYSVGLNVNYGGLTLGGSVKNTNAGFDAPRADGYLAFDAGFTYETGQWGFMVGYGNADAGPGAVAPLDAGLPRQTETTQAGISYTFDNNITFGAAAQVIDREGFADDPLRADRAVVTTFETSIDF